MKAPNELAQVKGKIRKYLEIKLRASHLEFAFDHAPWNEDEKCRQEYRICDREEFLDDLANALNREEEDGSTPLTRLLDECMEWLVEQGCLSVDEINENTRTRKESPDA